MQLKKAILLIACLLLLIPSGKCRAEPLSEKQERGLFVSVIQDNFALTSREEMDKLIGFAKRNHIGTLFIQIYRANMAWFPSQVGDAAPYQECLKAVGEDPLALLIRSAHASGIEVHAWVNMLSLSTNKDAKLLRKYGPDILTRNQQPKQKIEDYKIDSQYFLEPGDTRVRRELLAVVSEIVTQYPDLDGIQFDYIRYPDTHPAYGYTAENVNRFYRATGLNAMTEQDEVWRTWKRDQVTELLRQLVAQARMINPRIKVSATGCMNYTRAFDEAFQDWPSWLKRHIVDFVTMMSYPDSLDEFEKNIAEAREHVGNRFQDLNIGIGVYKLIQSPDVFQKQLGLCEHSGEKGCVIFHYGSMLENPALEKALK